MNETPVKSTPTPRLLSTTTRRGGAGAVTIAMAAAGIVAMSSPASAGDVVRVGGEDRVATAINVFESNRSSFGADTVILTRSDSYADSLTATPLAAATKSPILITHPSSLDSRVLAALKRQGIKNVGVVGGEQAISADVVRSLEAAGMKTLRAAGADRYQTSRMIADAVLKATGQTSAPAYVATGTAFPDALAAGAAAAKNKGMVLLSQGATLDKDTKNYLTSSKVKGVVAVGGPAVTAVNRAGVSATAIAGTNRYDTAAKLAVATYQEPASVVVTSGLTFADSLAGGVLAAIKGGPLLLTPPNAVAPETARYLAAEQPDVAVLGGPAAIDAGTLTGIDSASDGKVPGATPSPTATPTPSPTTTTTPPSSGGGGGGGTGGGGGGTGGGGTTGPVINPEIVSRYLSARTKTLGAQTVQLTGVLKGTNATMTVTSAVRDASGNEHITLSITSPYASASAAEVIKVGDLFYVKADSSIWSYKLDSQKAATYANKWVSMTAAQASDLLGTTPTVSALMGRMLTDGGPFGGQIGTGALSGTSTTDYSVTNTADGSSLVVNDGFVKSASGPKGSGTFSQWNAVTTTVSAPQGSIQYVG